MEEQKTIFYYLGQIFTNFGITMLFMLCFTKIFGESAKEISSFFVLGDAGVPLGTMAEYFLMSICITLIRTLFFTGYIIKKMSVAGRTAGMLFAIVVMIILFIFIFDWFPTDMWQVWVMFFLCFGLCTLISVVFSVLKTNMENKKLEEGLEHMKEQWRKEDE